MKWTNPDQKMKLATVDIPQKAAYLYFSNFPRILFNFLFVITEIGSLTSNLIHRKACFCQERDSLYTPRHIVPLWHEARLVSSPAHIGIARACLPAYSVFGQTPHESQESGETSTPILILFSTWPPCFMSTLNFWAISPFQIPAPSQRQQESRWLRILCQSLHTENQKKESSLIWAQRLWLRSLEYAPNFEKGKTNCERTAAASLLPCRCSEPTAPKPVGCSTLKRPSHDFGEQQTVMTFCSWFFAGPVFFLAKWMPNQASFLYKCGLKRQLEAPAFEIRWQTEPPSIPA